MSPPRFKAPSWNEEDHEAVWDWLRHEVDRFNLETLESWVVDLAMAVGRSAYDAGWRDCNAFFKEGETDGPA